MAERKPVLKITTIEKDVGIGDEMFTKLVDALNNCISSAKDGIEIRISCNGTGTTIHIYGGRGHGQIDLNEITFVNMNNIGEIRFSATEQGTDDADIVTAIHLTLQVDNVVKNITIHGKTFREE